MGMFPAGGDPLAFDAAAVAAEMRESLYPWFNARIQLFDPRSSTRTEADPTTGGGGKVVPLMVYDSGENGAFIDFIRSPQRVEFGSQNVGVQGAHVQTKLDLSLGVLRSGLQLRFVSGGEDDSLRGYLFEVDEGYDTSYAWGRIFSVSVVTSQALPLPNPGGRTGYGDGQYGKGPYGG